MELGKPPGTTSNPANNRSRKEDRGKSLETKVLARKSKAVLDGSFMKLLLPALALFLATTLISSAANLEDRIYNATHILEQRQGSANPIPAEILQNARGVAICTILKGGIGLGGQGGEGIVIVHHQDPNGARTWRAPSAFNISGASIGVQLGFSTTKYIIVLNTERAVGQFVNSGKVKFDATAAGTAGDDNVVEGQSTRDLEQHAVLVYRDSGGIFGGATLGGSSIDVKNEINQGYYGPHVYIRDILEGRVQPPTSAARLYELLNGTGR
jgi:lipid-binding SYLF domain-containing protein